MAIKFNLEGNSPLNGDQLTKIGKVIGESTNQQSELKLGLAFITKGEIRKLNKQYAGNDYYTDVLSFAYEAEGGQNNGDIAICTEIAKEQAKEHRIDIEAELALLLVHGSLHILGHDHQTKNQTASLDRLQGDIMKVLNYEYRDFKWSH